jgi:hypothetical protein
MAAPTTTPGSRSLRRQQLCAPRHKCRPLGRGASIPSAAWLGVTWLACRQGHNTIHPWLHHAHIGTQLQGRTTPRLGWAVAAAGWCEKPAIQCSAGVHATPFVVGTPSRHRSSGCDHHRWSRGRLLGHEQWSTCHVPAMRVAIWWVGIGSSCKARLCHVYNQISSEL